MGAVKSTATVGLAAWPSCSEACEGEFVRSESAVNDGVDVLQRELELLRHENQELRSRNKMLEFHSVPLHGSPAVMVAPSPHILFGEPVAPQLPADVFDDPYEPPPEAQSWTWQEPLGVSRKLSLDLGSTDAGSDFSFETSSISSRMSVPLELRSGFASEATSGAATPVHPAPIAQQGCTLVPMWFPMMPSAANFFDTSVIPRGIVQSARLQFERIAG